MFTDWLTDWLTDLSNGSSIKDLRQDDRASHTTSYLEAN